VWKWYTIQAKGHNTTPGHQFLPLAMDDFLLVFSSK
jgi:hypothetical protein